MQTVAVDLSEEHKRTLKRLGEEYKKWINSDDGLKEIREHREHQAIFTEKLSSENIDSLTENEFKEICKNMWALGGWTNKEWRIQNKILTPNGFDKIKSELKKLLYGTEEFVHRYDNFRRNIKGLGIASLSEMLNMIFPDRYCLWNVTHREVIPFLKLDTLLPPEFFKEPGASSGGEYYQCLQLLTAVKNELAEFDIRNFLDLDFFLWHMREHIIPSSEKKQLKIKDKETSKKEDQVALWVVRAREGQQEQVALQNNIIAIGWEELPDLSSVKDKKEDLIKRYSEVYSEKTGHEQSSGYSQVWNFLKTIKKGDIVAIPLKSEDNIAIGKVVGDYEYKKEYGDNIGHTRPVDRFKKIPKSEFDSNSIKAFERRPTIYKIEGAQEDHIKKILLKHGIKSEIDKQTDSQAEYGVFLTGYPESNLAISKQHQILDQTQTECNQFGKMN